MWWVDDSITAIITALYIRYVWETNLIETLTNLNANRRNWFCCLVLSILWPTIEFELQLMKTGDVCPMHEIEWQCFKIDLPKTKLKWAFAHFKVSGTRLKTDFWKLNKEVTKMGGRTYIILSRDIRGSSDGKPAQVKKEKTRKKNQEVGELYVQIIMTSAIRC